MTNSIYYDIKFYHPFLVILIFFCKRNVRFISLVCSPFYIYFFLLRLMFFIWFQTLLPATVKNTILVAGMIWTAKSNLTISWSGLVIAQYFSSYMRITFKLALHANNFLMENKFVAATYEGSCSYVLFTYVLRK